MSQSYQEDRFERERQELASVLASVEFQRAPVMSRILRYICEQYFNGQAHSIKEYNIAVEALGKPADFDPATDSIVRTHVTRLRKHLEKYYSDGPGVHHAIKILLSPSGYSPLFIVSAENGNKFFTGQKTLILPRWNFAPPQFVILVLLFTIALFGFLISRKWRSQTIVTEPVIPAAMNALPTFPQGALADDVRILVGLTGHDWFDTSGLRWSADRFYTGGTVSDRLNRHIYRTQDSRIYQTPREGDFRYDIPVAAGLYEVRLHFAETFFAEPDPWTGWEYNRVFDVLVNGAPALQDFDVAADAQGLNTATVRVLRDIRPAADGRISLEFKSKLNRALLNAIELLPMRQGRTRPVRILCGSPHSAEIGGVLWLSDRFFQGGRPSKTWRPLEREDHSKLFEHNRWGPVKYVIPVAPGTYSASLYFAETHFGPTNPGEGGEGKRVFDIYCNHVLLATKLDVLRKAGGPNRGLRLTFRGLKPNVRGKLEFDFVPVRDYPNVYAIEVSEEGK